MKNFLGQSWLRTRLGVFQNVPELKCQSVRRKRKEKKGNDKKNFQGEVTKTDL